MSHQSMPVLAGTLVIASFAIAQAQPAPPAQPSAPRPAAPAPAIQAGETVFDRTGQAVGAVQGLVETPAGAMVVAQVDGKLISLPQSTLRVEGRRVVSAQTKAQMLAAAGAPR